MYRSTKIILVGIVALAALFRFGALDTIPPGIWPDEAINGVEGWRAVESGDFKIFYPTNNGREGLWINMIGLTVHAFGANQFGLRFPAALTGTLTVLGLFFLTRELFAQKNPVSDQMLPGDNPNDKVQMPNQIQSPNAKNNWILKFGFFDKIPSNEIIALLSAFFLATSYWHLNFSRIAFRANMVPLLLVWSFYLLCVCQPIS